MVEGDPGSDWLWCIDPLDGTTNFAHGYPSFATSIGARSRQLLIAFVCADSEDVLPALPIKCQSRWQYTDDRIWMLRISTPLYHLCRVLQGCCIRHNRSWEWSWSLGAHHVALAHSDVLTLP